MMNEVSVVAKETKKWTKTITLCGLGQSLIIKMFSGDVEAP